MTRMVGVVGGGGGGTAVDLWEVIEDYENTGTITTKTFNFSNIDFDTVSKLVLVFDGKATLGLNLQLRFNLDTGANYYYEGRRISGTETLISGATQSSIQLASSTIFATGQIMFGVVEIGFSDQGDARPMLISTMTSGGSAQEQMTGILAATEAGLTDITILVSTSSIAVGARMTLYKVKRA